MHRHAGIVQYTNIDTATHNSRHARANTSLKFVGSKAPVRPPTHSRGTQPT
jgi:hypothetical protein